MKDKEVKTVDVYLQPIDNVKKNLAFPGYRAAGDTEGKEDRSLFLAAPEGACYNRNVFNNSPQVNP